MKLIDVHTAWYAIWEVSPKGGALCSNAAKRWVDSKRLDDMIFLD
ncbi:MULTISPECIES: hypothetical protein [Pseudomonas]|nr:MULTISPECIES: hypothetical protein [Pseudomonas]